MRLRSLSGAWVGALVLAGCAAPPASCPASTPVTPAVVAIPSAEPPHGSETVSEAAPPDGVCYPEGRPAALPVAKVSTFCTSFDMHELARVEARVRKEVVLETKPSKLVVDFGCDVAYGPTRELVLEQGSGHGGSLVVTRLQRGMDRWSVRRIRSAHYSGKALTVEVGDVPAIKIGELVASARVAMLAKPHVIPLFDPAVGHGSGSGSFSSRDFHLYLGIVDDAGRRTERGFTGYDSSMSQGDIIPMRLATEPLVKLIDATTFTEVPPDSDDRAFFTERLISTLEHDAGWWVRERYLENASKLATRDAVPALAARITRPIADGKNGSDVRSRDKAIEALHVLTGWDPRLDAQSKPRPIEATVEAVRRACLAD